jgi:LuxR family maltose regulon positive regulatory protein
LATQSGEETSSTARGLLERGDLFELLDRAVTGRVTVISAPPGSGKTTLLRTWAGRSANQRAVTFVSVERDEQDPQRFWSSVLNAITGPEKRSGAPAALHGEQLVEEVLSALADLDGPLLLIDDLHELRSAEALRQLEHLLEVLPSSAGVILSSRRDPPIKLHRLRLAGELAELRAGELRFSQDETRELLASSAIALSDAGVAALHERTEGWAAGLRLAVISLSGHPEPERFVTEFSGTNRAIGEYLMAEMLEGQPDDVRRMLLRTSLVDGVNGELADLLAGQSGSEQMLLSLEEANAFVVSLDAQRTSFRYHQLLADFLRLELRRTSADEIPELHRRAARWFADRGNAVEAVRHTLAAGDWPDAARLLADHLFSLTLDGKEGAIGSLLELFPEGASVDHPDLSLARAATLLAQGRLEEAANHLALAEAHVQSARPRLAVAVASLRLALARRTGVFTEVREQVDLLDASIAAGAVTGSELRGVALMNLGIVEMWTGRLADAERHLDEGAELASTIGRPYLEVVCRAHQGFPSRTVSVATARERGCRALTLAESYGWEDRPELAPALGAVAGMAIWMGEFDEGEHWLRRAWEVAQPRVDPAATVLLHVATGMLYGGRRQHQATLDAFEAAAHAQSLLAGVHALAPRIAGWIASTQARLGMRDQARATLAAFSGPPEQMGAIGNAHAVIALEEGDAGAALAVLRDICDAAFTPSFTLVEAHLLAGIAHLHLDERSLAATAAEAALATAEPDRLLLPFAVTGAAELLDALPHHQTAHGALLNDVVDLLRDASAPSVAEGQGEELSPSELRVLRYLPTNLTRPEIARELYVSVNTVNTHVRSIYSKLGARDRSAAVRRARELRILSSGRPRSSPA